MGSAKIGERLVALFLLGALMISPPLLAIFRADVLIAGIPLLFLYLFACWGVLIAVLALIVETSREPETGAEPPDPKHPG